MKHRRIGASFCLTVVSPCVLALLSACQGSVVGHDHFALRDGMRIHLWQKCLSGRESAAAERGKVALLIHGGTWSGRPDFDLQIRDYSFMDFLARNGYDAWAIDIHGYGQSDKSSKDWSDSASAALDLASAVEYICSLRKIPRVKMLGWSWGTQIAGIYAADHPDRIGRLILYGNVWKGPPDWRTIPLPTTGYRTNGEDDARSDFIPEQYEPDVVEAYVREALKTDPASPNGVLVDLSTRLPLIDPERITIPTLVIRAEHDFASTPKEMLEFFDRLQSADKSYVCLPDGGHDIILEKGHRGFQQAVLAFFDRP
jgi:pimeloyl-ACP methyl ester carboxylesterase